MANPYTVLGVALDADDATIRRKYLELTTQFPPEEHPEQSAQIREAYDRIKNLDARVKYRLFDFGVDDSIESILEEAVCMTPLRRIPLKELLISAKVPTGSLPIPSKPSSPTSAPG